VHRFALRDSQVFPIATSPSGESWRRHDRMPNPSRFVLNCQNSTLDVRATRRLRGYVIQVVGLKPPSPYPARFSS